MGLYDFTIYSIAKRNARVYGNRAALIFGNQRITHRQFLEKIDRLSHGLLEIGVEKGDRIGILGQNSLEYVYLYGAAAKIGAIVLPINWRLNVEEIKYIISDGAPKVLFAGPEYQEMITPMISKFGIIENLYALEGGEDPFKPFNDLQGGKGHYPEVDVRTDDDFVIVYTAALEGRPRGAVLSHGNLINYNYLLMYYWSLTKEDTHLLMLPLFHNAGLGLALAVMHAGGANVIMSKFDVDLALKHIEGDKATVFTEFAPILQSILVKAEEGKRDLSSLRHFGPYTGRLKQQA
jgi:acyl-CoA synthetase (AMP-forming)/AMP-acid ligase II